MHAGAEGSRSAQRSHPLELELGSSRLLLSVLDALADAVTIRTLDNRLVYANRAALEHMELSSVEELRAADPRALMEPYETVGEDGRAVTLEDLPSVRLLRGERPEPLMLRTVQRNTGDEHWVLLKAAPVPAADGSVEASVTIIEDVTDTKRASLRAEFMVQAGRVLSSSLDYEQTLRNVAALAVPQIADWCAVDLFDSDGDRTPVAIAHKDPGKLQMAERLRAYQPERLDPERGLGKVLRTGEPELYPEIPDVLLVQSAIDEEHLRLLREVGMRSALVVPMRVREKVIGAISMVSAESRRRFDQDDVDFASQIADRAVLAVERARLYTERSHIAYTLQRSLLPDSLPAIPGWEVADLYMPGGAEQSTVGGDFYDLWPVGDDWLVMIGDVTGKGVDAAALTSLARHTAWEASESDAQPAYVLSRVDAALKRRGYLSVCTALCMRLHGEGGTVAVGGHPLPLHAAAGEVTNLGVPGSMLGGLEDPHWPQVPFELRPGDTLVAFTDGVTDAVGPEHSRFGLPRLRKALAEGAGETAAQLGQRLRGSLERFQSGEQADDIAVLVMRCAGHPHYADGVAASTSSAAQAGA